MLGRMGFDELASYRNQFPVSDHLIYLNHAAVAPLVRPAAVAMQQLAEDALRNGAANYQQWLDAYAGLRKSAARMINAQPDEIAEREPPEDCECSVDESPDRHYSSQPRTGESGRGVVTGAIASPTERARCDTGGFIYAASGSSSEMSKGMACFSAAA